MKLFMMVLTTLFGRRRYHNVHTEVAPNRTEAERKLEAKIAALRLTIEKMEALPNIFKFSADDFQKDVVPSQSTVDLVGPTEAKRLIKGRVLGLYGATQEFRELYEELKRESEDLQRYALDNFEGVKAGVRARGKLLDVEALCNYCYHEPRLWHGTVVDQMLDHDKGYVN